MPGISIHAVDVARGIVASGMRVELFSFVSEGDNGETGELIARGVISAAGTLDDPALTGTFMAGRYEAVFHVAAYHRDVGISLAGRSVSGCGDSYRFGIADPQQHYHLPFKFTAWGYSCFRGGA